MNRARNVLFAVIALAVVLPLLAFQLPVPKGLPDVVESAEEFQYSMASTVAFAWLHIGSAILFLVGLKDFKGRLRHAYAAICLGLVCMSAAMVEIPAFIALDLFDSAWVQAGLLPLPYVVASLLVFMGVRSFARALSVNSILLRPEVVFPVLAAITVAAGLAASGIRPAGYSFEIAAGLWNVALLFITALIVVRIKRIAGPAYTNALAWFAVALIGSSVAFGGPPLVLVLGVEQGAYLAVPFVIVSLAYVKAGYAFNKISEY